MAPAVAKENLKGGDRRNKRREGAVVRRKPEPPCLSPNSSQASATPTGSTPPAPARLSAHPRGGAGREGLTIGLLLLQCEKCSTTRGADRHGFREFLDGGAAWRSRARGGVRLQSRRPQRGGAGIVGAARPAGTPSSIRLFTCLFRAAARPAPLLRPAAAWLAATGAAYALAIRKFAGRGASACCRSWPFPQFTSPSGTARTPCSPPPCSPAGRSSWSAGRSSPA